MSLETTANPVRIGLLGTARISGMAILSPARRNPNVSVVAVASRSENKARAYAKSHRIARAYSSYQNLLDDPEIDVIYNPLPNHLHAEWSIRALRAGKHVLCEKPLAANAEEASAMQATAEQTGRLLMEAFHYRYHALAARMKEIASGGTLGTVRRVEAQFCIYLPGRKDIRFWYETAGGALMDTGCYAVNVCRFLIGTEPTVKTATVCLLKPDVDSGISAELEFANGITASVATSLRTPVWKWRAFVRVTGDEGTLTVLNPFLPQFFNCLTVQTRAGKSREFLPRHPSTYACQLEALVAAVRGGPMMPTDGLDGIQNMRVIDAIYAASGLRRRGEGA